MMKLPEGRGGPLFAVLLVVSAMACGDSSTEPGSGDGGTGGSPADTLVRLTDDQYDRNHPCWNSSGSEIWFTRYEVTQPGNELTSNIWSIPASGGAETQKTFYPGFTDFPAVRPSFLAFRSNHDGFFDVYMQSSSLSNLTNSPAKDFEIACTPIGSSGLLAFSKADSLHGGVVWNIYMLATGLEQVSTGNKDFHPTFSEMGTYIAFQRTHNEVDGAQVIVIPRNGGAEVAVTPFGESCRHPDWNRAYDRIAFCRGGDVYMRNPDGSDERQLTFETQFAQYPAWSPNGRYLAYVDHVGGRYAIFVKDVKHILTAP